MTESANCNPVLATVVRGGEVESVHRGSAVVADARGDTVLAVGDITRAVFPRSSYKFIQAVPLVESGAADAFGLGSEEIALACASHNAEPVHMERVDMGQGWVGVNTSRTNQVMTWFLERGQVPGLDGYTGLRREPVYLAPGFPKSRFDALLTGAGRRDCYVEVKNTTLYTDGAVRFPDAVTERGRKHLLLLEHAVSEGRRGVILFAVNRPEGEVFSPTRLIDPDYADTLSDVTAKGVEALAVRIRHTPKGVRMGGLLPVDLGG